ncbi:MAG: type II toxin-antitoxin system VapC family toxin, partial [Acaryochloridaceae cyanobacterium RL_2_7]|nr:type II toxin-antitoxin system VapC family toxin [Acaryochloridaceae cyanobacterium RL_2_7]
MVFTYALLKVEDHYEQALAVLSSTDRIVVPDSLFAELGNVVWQWIQFRQLPLATGFSALEDAEALVDIMIPSVVLRDLALELAVQKSHSFYDTLFVAAAMYEQTQVLTYDVKLAKKFSTLVQLL